MSETLLFLIIYQLQTDPLPLIALALAPIITVIVSVFAGEKIADHLYG